MGRLYLDTNMLVYMLNGERDRIDDNTNELITDCANTLYTSAACVHELIGLLHLGKVGRGKTWKKGISVVDRLHEFGITVQPVTEANVKVEETLPWFDDHKDPIDRLIVAQAISDKATLVSSDREFPRYQRFGLFLVENIP